MVRRRILSLFGRKSDPAPPPALVPLPEVVRDVIDSASVVFRAGTGENAGEDHAIVQIPGFTGFKFSSEGAAKVIARSWPELEEHAVSQAVRRLGQLVAARRRQHAQGATTPDTRPWINRY